MSATISSERKVQRPTDELPTLHLESAVPQPEVWELKIDGMVANPAVYPIEQIRNMAPEHLDRDLHCVWGWVKPGCRWEGVSVSRLLAAAGPLPEATHVVAKAIEGRYAACFTLAEAADSFLAWGLDGEELTAEHGAPLRLVQPENKWAYKGIKWIGALTLVGSFQPGFWESLVGNPHGDIPPEMLDLRHE